MADRKGSRFTGWVFLRDFRNARNVVSQAAIPWAHQSLGATAKRRGLFRTITDRAIGDKKAKKLRNKECGIDRDNDDDALKSPSAAICRIYVGAKSFRAKAENADKGYR